jgi:hypothetical protein
MRTHAVWRWATCRIGPALDRTRHRVTAGRAPARSHHFRFKTGDRQTFARQPRPNPLAPIRVGDRRIVAVDAERWFLLSSRSGQPARLCKRVNA